MNLILENDLAKFPADTYLMTHTTNPLVSGGTIKQAITAFRKQSGEGLCDSMFSVTRHQTRFYNAQLEPINHDPDRLIPTQDLDVWFEENSNFYLFTPESFESTSARIGKKPSVFPVPAIESIDIDTWDDWYLAAAIAKGAAS